jgi:hypothetical protein
MYSAMHMWTLEPTTQWQRDQKWYEKKHPDELAAVKSNLSRYFKFLCIALNSKLVQAGYIHGEGMGIYAIDQKAGGSNLAETRLYVYPHDETKILYIITIGNKSKQSEDIKFCKEFVKNILEKEKD